jgi:hypothetical protein
VNGSFACFGRNLIYSGVQPEAPQRFLTRNRRAGKVRAMLRLVIFICIATLLGCGRGGVFRSQPDTAEAEAQWFCQAGENAEEWQCVQDAELSRSLNPSRMPPREPPTSAPPPEQPAPTTDG